MTVTTKLRARVRAGMAFLDAVKPSWRKKIDLKELDLSDGSCCVLGEVYGEFRDGMDSLFGPDPREDDYNIQEDPRDGSAEALGFWLRDKETDRYPRLTRIWREEYRKGQRAAARAAR